MNKLTKTLQWAISAKITFFPNPTKYLPTIPAVTPYPGLSESVKYGLLVLLLQAVSLHLYCTIPPVYIFQDNGLSESTSVLWLARCWFSSSIFSF